MPVAKIEYISVEEASKLWELSIRSVRNYCAQGRVPGALLNGKTWKIPSNAEKPGRKTRHIETESNLLAFLKREKESVLRVVFIIKFRLTLHTIQTILKVQDFLMIRHVLFLKLKLLALQMRQ